MGSTALPQTLICSTRIANLGAPVHASWCCGSNLIAIATDHGKGSNANIALVEPSAPDEFCTICAPLKGVVQFELDDSNTLVVRPWVHLCRSTAWRDGRTMQHASMNYTIPMACPILTYAMNHCTSSTFWLCESEPSYLHTEHHHL